MVTIQGRRDSSPSSKNQFLGKFVLPRNCPDFRAIPKGILGYIKEIWAKPHILGKLTKHLGKHGKKGGYIRRILVKTAHN
jgi:hypothetical protein